MLTKNQQVDDTLVNFFSSFVKYLVLVVTVVAVLNHFGVKPASLLTVIGAAGLAIGLTLQGIISNVAAGVILLTFRPFNVGDYVEVAGKAPTVKELNLFFTELTTPDNVRTAVLKAPEAFIGVAEMADSSVNIVVRVWVNNADYWPVKFDLTKNIKQALDSNGINIPFPTHTVYTQSAD